MEQPVKMEPTAYLELRVLKETPVKLDIKAIPELQECLELPANLVAGNVTALMVALLHVVITNCHY